MLNDIERCAEGKLKNCRSTKPEVCFCYLVSLDNGTVPSADRKITIEIQGDGSDSEAQETDQEDSFVCTFSHSVQALWKIGHSYMKAWLHEKVI